MKEEKKGYRFFGFEWRCNRKKRQASFVWRGSVVYSTRTPHTNMEIIKKTQTRKCTEFFQVVQ